MTTRTEENRQRQTHNERRVVGFAFCDDKRRFIGAQVATWNAHMEATESGYGRSTLPPGPAYGLNLMQTRNGMPYGASQPDQWFATTADRDAAVAAYLKAAQTRAARKFNPA